MRRRAQPGSGDGARACRARQRRTSVAVGGVKGVTGRTLSSVQKFSTRIKRTWEMYRCAHNVVQIIIVVVPGVPDVCPRCYQQQLGQNPFLKERDPLLASVARRQVQKQGSGDVHVPMRCWIGQYLHGAVAIHHCYSFLCGMKLAHFCQERVPSTIFTV